MFKHLTHARFARAGIASAVIAAAVIVAVSAGALSGGSKSQAAGPTSMTVVAPSSAAVGSSFNATVQGANPGLATIGGYAMELGYNPAVVNPIAAADGGANAPGTCTAGAGNWAAPQLSPTVQTGCAFQVLSTAGPWDDDIITFDCVAPGNSPLLLIDTIADPISGSTFFDTNAVNLGTDLTSASIDCVLPFTKTVSAGPYVADGVSSVTYTIHVGNPTAVSISGQVVGDTLPAGLTATSITSPTDGGAICSLAPLGCVGTAQPDPIGLDVVITATIELPAAGQTLTNCAQLNPPAGPVACVPINVAPAVLSIAKVATLGSYQAGDSITWDITVTNTGLSTAGAVEVTDQPTDGQVSVLPTTFGPADLAGGASVTYSVTNQVTDPNPVDNTCNNDATATASNAATATTSGSATCLSKNVRMVKSTDGNTAPTNSGGLVNLFLNKTCGPNNDQLCPLDVYEWALNVGGDPDGVGAFEFQVKYDNHIFDISIEATSWLYDTGRVEGAPGIGGCAATIFTENDIRFGCVSKNPVDGNGDPIITTGNTVDGVIAIIHVTPKADLVNRITPGNDNGAIRSLLDEGCEFADIWGHPLSTNGLDALGREILLPGVGPGGVINDCADITITVRILEGDMNLDCSVTVADDQIEASHYGAMFGNLLYQPWYDLEPWLKDGDVDIKDLQKVFGRNGSTCANPIPAQPAQPEPVDP